MKKVCCTGCLYKGNLDDVANISDLIRIGFVEKDVLSGEIVLEEKKAEK